MKQDIAEIAGRVEAARGHDRDLEGDIYAAFGGDAFWGARRPDGRYDVRNPVPHYTTSLDAAMTLVPEGLWRRINVDPNGRANVRLGDACAVTAATPALALTAAALKARAHLLAHSHQEKKA